MRKKLIFSGIALTLTALISGCFLMDHPQKQPEIYDLPLRETKISARPLRIGSIRNLSGADRRVQLRKNDNQIRQVEDYLWLLPPPAMLERELKERFSEESSQQKIPVLHTVLRHFEFDLTKKEAFFGVNYEIIMPDGKHLSIAGNYREKIQEDRYTQAMAEAIHRSLDDLDAALKKSTEK